MGRTPLISTISRLLERGLRSQLLVVHECHETPFGGAAEEMSRWIQVLREWEPASQMHYPQHNHT